MRREFGNVGVVKEVTREMWGGGSLERLMQDLRYGARTLRRSMTPPPAGTPSLLELPLSIVPLVRFRADRWDGTELVGAFTWEHEADAWLELARTHARLTESS